MIPNSFSSKLLYRSADIIYVAISHNDTKLAATQEDSIEQVWQGTLFL
jgi:hypothetical protein